MYSLETDQYIKLTNTEDIKYIDGQCEPTVSFMEQIHELQVSYVNSVQGCINFNQH